MHRRIIALCLLLLCFLSSPLAAAGPVWKVSNGKHTLYLGGTIHLLRQSDFPLPPAFDTAYHASDRLVFETDIGAFQRPEIQRRLMYQMTYHDGRTLKEALTRKTFLALKKYWVTNRLDTALLEQAKPMLVMLVMLQQELSRMGQISDGVDNYLYARGVRDGKGVSGLVDTEEHLALFAEMTRGNEEAFVKNTLDEVASLPRLFEQILTHWRDGDADAMDSDLVLAMREETPELYEKLLVERNLRWLGTIRGYLNDATVEFVLVGSAHLVGDEGLLRLLASEGYRVEQLP